MTEDSLRERLANAIAAHRAEVAGTPGEMPAHACSPACSAEVRRHAGAAEWTTRALGMAWSTHLHNMPLGEVDGQPTWTHDCGSDCAPDIAARFVSRSGEWRDSRLIPFTEHLDNLVADLASEGIRIPRHRLAFACMPALSRAGMAEPPASNLLDEAGGARHYDALVAAGCPVIEVRGAGWISGRRYLVLLDHAWGSGSSRQVACSWTEQRGTVGVLPSSLFEALERREPTRRAAHSLARRFGFRKTSDIRCRPGWNVGSPSDEQGCPTVPLLAD
jgi:hypothetical protein